MKKSDKVSLISALSAIAGVSIHDYLKKNGLISRQTKAIYTVTPLSLFSGILANRFIEEDAPRSYEDYLKEVAEKNIR